MKLTDIAWAAGIIEGEGSARKRSTPEIRVVQKDPWLCSRLQELFGGVIYSHRGTTTGRMYGVWTVTGVRARGLAMTIYPLMSPRRQAQLLPLFKS